MSKMSSTCSHELQLTPNLVLVSTSARRFLSDKPLGPLAAFKGLDDSCENQHRLCILPGWFAAKKRHLMKFAQYYLDQDFDVLLALSTVSQVFSLVSTTNKMAKDALEFFDNNQQHYGPIVIHGFSAGAAGWGCLLTHVNKNPEKFQFLHDKIVGQVWDSPFIDMDRLPQTGSAMAFPDSPLLQKIAQLFLLVHMKLQRAESDFFNNSARGFHNLNTKKSSFLLFTSEDDPVALCSAVVKCAEEWRSEGCKVYCKIWQRSPHVCHMKENPEEYTTLLKDFLHSISLLKYPDRFQIAKKKAGGGKDPIKDLVVKMDGQATQNPA